MYKLINGDVLESLRELPDNSVHCVVTSPPYWGLRDYGHDGQIGMESSPDAYAFAITKVFGELRGKLRNDAVCWLNIGDSYDRGKRLAGVPWRVALALDEDGWLIRQDCIWSKPSPMPESVRDRCTRSHEYVFLIANGLRYFFDAEAIKETSKHLPGQSKNRRSVWNLATTPFSGAHFATMPTALAEICIKSGTSEKGCCPHCGSPWQRLTERTKLTRKRPNDYVKRTGEAGTGNSCANSVAGVAVKTLGWSQTCDCKQHEPVPCVVLDPFAGSGTTLYVAEQLGRDSIGIELNPEYLDIAQKRLSGHFDKKKGGKKKTAKVGTGQKELF